MSFREIVQFFIQINSEGYTWVLQVFLIVFLTLIANFVAVRSLSRLKNELERTTNLFDDCLVEASSKPLAVLIWVIGLSWAANIVYQVSGAEIFKFIVPARKVLFIGLLAWFGVRFTRLAEVNLIGYESGALDPTTIRALGKIFSAAIIITGALIILQTLGYSISGLMAVGGIGGIAVGFAAKDLLANFFGGFMIFLDRPFNVGDWIRSPDKNIEGIVEDISWRQTTIRTFEKRPLYVPNSTFSNIAVENPSRMSNRRIKETIGIRYEDMSKMRVIVQDVKSMLEQHTDIDSKQTLIVNFNSFAPSSLDFFIYTFTKTTNWVRYHAVKEDVLLKVLDIIEEHDAEMAYPTSTVYFSQNKVSQNNDSYVLPEAKPE